MADTFDYKPTPLAYTTGAAMANVALLLSALANPSPMANPDFADISAKGRELLSRELTAIITAGAA